MVTSSSVSAVTVRVLDADHDYRADARPVQSATRAGLRIADWPEQPPVGMVQVERQVPCPVCAQLVAAAWRGPHSGQRVGLVKVFQPLLDLLGADRLVLLAHLPYVLEGLGEIGVIKRYLQRVRLLSYY